MNTRSGWAFAVGVLGLVLLLGTAGAVQPATAASLADAARRYQGRIREAKLEYLADLKAVLKTAMSKGDLEGAKRIETVRLQMEKELDQDSWRDVPNVPESVRTPAKPANADADGGVEPGSLLDKRVLGDWVLENDGGTMVSAMQAEGGADGQVVLTRVGGGPLAVCGTYAVEGRRLVKVKVPGDAHWDLTWHAGGSTWVLRSGQYDGWTLKRPAGWAAKRSR